MVNPNFICHRLNVNSECTPKKQKPRSSSHTHLEVVKEIVDKLKQAKAVKEVFYLEWLSNTVVVKKKIGKWRVYVGFTNLNRACLNDPFLIPKIDQLVGATFDHPRMSFLNAIQGYYQIALAPKD